MFHPITEFEVISDEVDFAMKSRMGCILLAGGQASRLGGDLPKGMVPITLVKNKSLFQFLLEKAKAAMERESKAMPIAIMTSPLNHQIIYDFLTESDFFGFPKEHVYFFEQTMRALEDREGQVLDIFGPDGNGGTLHQFYRAGIWKEWKKMGIECVHVIPVDNPLADPFDPKIAFHGEDVIIQAIPRENPDEKVGVLVQENDQIKVVEYTELPEFVQKGMNEAGELRFSLANSGLYCFSMDFIERQKDISLPWHRHNKTIRVEGNEKDIYKYETFIFDLIPYAKRVKILIYSREDAFAPLKNKNGEGSLAQVQQALLQKDRSTFYKITGNVPDSDKIFELDPVFYYPVSALFNKWKGRVLPNSDYIRP